MSNLSLPRFQANAPLVDENGCPSQAFHIWWNTFASNLEKAFNDLSTNVADIAAAQAAAAVAQTTANTAKINDKISASATKPSSVVMASDAGTSATITIAAHIRQYGDNTQVSVSGGSITGLAYSTTYAVYYDDTSASTTTPSYQATTSLNTAQPNYAAGRHYVDQVTTPASGGGAVSGGGSRPPGGGGPYP